MQHREHRVGDGQTARVGLLLYESRRVVALGHHAHLLHCLLGAKALADELPQLANPTCGFLQNCNQGPLTTVPHGTELAAGQADENPPADRFPPYMIGEREGDNGRARISRRILHATERFDFDAWTRAGFDTRVLEAEARVPELVAEYEAVA